MCAFVNDSTHTVFHPANDRRENDSLEQQLDNTIATPFDAKPPVRASSTPTPSVKENLPPTENDKERETRLVEFPCGRPGCDAAPGDHTRNRCPVVCRRCQRRCRSVKACDQNASAAMGRSKDKWLKSFAKAQKAQMAIPLDEKTKNDEKIASKPKKNKNNN